MAYNYYPQYQQVPYQQQPSYQPNQIQSSGFIPVPSEEVARNYPVAPGNSVSFRNENLPYLYTKTMGFSQFDHPIFKKYKLIEEEAEASTASTPEANRDTFDAEGEITKLQKDVGKMWSEINALKKSARPNATRSKDGEDRSDE